MQLTSPVRGLRHLRFVRWSITGLALSAVLNLIQWAYLLWNVHPRVEPIPIHYTITVGIDRIGPWYMAFLLPVSGTMVLILNFLIVLLVIERQPVTAQFTVILSLMLELLLVISAVLLFRVG